MKNWIIRVDGKLTLVIAEGATIQDGILSFWDGANLISAFAVWDSFNEETEIKVYGKTQSEYRFYMP